jgi:S1-C subfamily serine protease
MQALESNAMTHSLKIAIAVFGTLTCCQVFSQVAQQAPRQDPFQEALRRESEKLNRDRPNGEVTETGKDGPRSIRLDPIHMWLTGIQPPPKWFQRRAEIAHENDRHFGVQSPLTDGPQYEYPDKVETPTVKELAAYMARQHCFSRAQSGESTCVDQMIKWLDNWSFGSSAAKLTDKDLSELLNRECKPRRGDWPWYSQKVSAARQDKKAGHRFVERYGLGNDWSIHPHPQTLLDCLDERADQQIAKRNSLADLRRLDAAHGTAKQPSADQRPVIKDEPSLQVKAIQPLDDIAWKPPEMGWVQQTSPTGVAADLIYQTAGKSVYLLRVERQDGKVISFGTAIAISNRDALTNCHVFPLQYHRMVLSDDLDGDRVVEVVGRDTKNDQCVVRSIKPNLLPIAKVRSSGSVRIGERVYAIGNPQGLTKTISEGIVSGKRTIKAIKFIQTTAPISAGSSGGGLFDHDGNLLGITTSGLRESQNLNLAIPAEDFLKK